MIGLLIIGRTVARGLRALAADPRSRGLLLLAVGLILVGAFFYRLVEGLAWLDSVYFTVVTLTTVGYGDFVPQTAAGKIFTMVYLLIGIGVLVAVASDVAGHVIRAAQADDPDGQR